MKQLKYLALATLVAFAACDEGTDVVVTPPVTGDIVGTVTIEGAAVSNVTVTLSTGESVTPVNGAYSFTGVAAGAYTVTIAGFDANATFSSTSKAVTITANAQVATVNFAGSWVRTSAVLGSVAAGGVGLPGVNVSLTGVETKSTVTSSEGTYSFTGLRAGTYTVAISGFAANVYAFANATQTVDPGTGEAVVADFVGLRLATSAISGTLFIDGNDNEQMDVGEPPIMKAGITVALERAIGDTIYTTTDANGMYTFPDLEEGTYKVIVDGTQASIPGAYTQSGDIRYLAVATSGGATTVNFPFLVTTQYVWVYGMLGVDGVNSGVAPIKNWTVTLYPTDTDARKEINKISTGTVKTDATGLATFKFLRTADYSPNAAAIDGIVFAKVASPGAGYALNGEKTIEIPWVPFDSLVMAPDTFDATYNTLVVKVKAEEIDGDSLPNWKVQFRPGKDSTAAVNTVLTTNAKGWAYVTVAGTPGTFPDTAWFRLHPTQPDGGHAWMQTPAGSAGTALGRNLRVIWDGTVGPADTVMAGTESVKYMDANVTVNVHREQDDTMGFTAGDNKSIGASGVDALLYEVKSSGKTLTSTINAVTGVGTATFLNVDVSKTWELRARAKTANYKVLNDTALALTGLDGSDQTLTVATLKGSAGNSAFMVKTTNNELKGRVYSRHGATQVPGLTVTATPTAMNIQGTATRVDVTRNNGLYILDSLREGPYTVTVTAGDSAYVFLRTLTTTPVPATSAVTSGSANNASPTTGVRDLQGVGDIKQTFFEAYRTDTEFSGLVVNDRDTDLTTIDPGEALAGATINLYRDDDGSATAGTDTLVTSATSDAGGMYSFTNLVEGRYTAVWVAGTPSADVQVMTKLSTAGTPTTKVSATTLMGANVKHVGNLPAWNYANPGVPSNLLPANFTFLYANTVVRGTILKQSDLTPVPGMSITMQKCFLSTANAGGSALTNVSGPRPDDAGATTCTSFFAGSSTVTSAADGTFQFANLREGVYRVTPAPGTVPPYAAFVGVATGFAASPGVDDGRSGLFLTVGSGDIESLTFHVY
jgi:hypothetical protein